MRYLMSVIDDGDGLASASEMQAIETFNEGLIAAGFWVMAAGIGAPESAVTFDHRGSSRVRLEQPFIDASAYLAGFWIIDVPDRETALRLAAEGSHACNRRVELRPFLEASPGSVPVWSDER